MGPGMGPGHDDGVTRVGLRDASLCSLSPPKKMIQTTRDEVNACFSEIIQEVTQLQMKVLDFVEKEEAAALGKLGSSIRQSHNRLLKLERDSIWLRTLLTNQSDQQFLQVRPHPPHPHLCPRPCHDLHSPSTHRYTGSAQTLDKGISAWGCITLSIPLPQGASIAILSLHQHPWPLPPPQHSASP